MTKQLKQQFQLVCTSVTNVEVFRVPVDTGSTPDKTRDNIIRLALDIILKGGYFGDADDLDGPDSQPLDVTAKSKLKKTLTAVLLQHGQITFPGIYINVLDERVHEKLTLELVVASEELPVNKGNFNECWEICALSANIPVKKEPKKTVKKNETK